jgi:hypothetical protein
VLLVPQASSESSKRVSITLPLSFDDALKVIHEIVGCTNVSRKPTIAYKLSCATQKAKPVDLCSEVDWKGCLEDVSAAEIKRKGQSVPIVIIIPDQVCRELHVLQNTHRKYWHSTCTHFGPTL